MGKTSDKLNYLDETKEIIKQALIDKGVDVSDTDTFRSFANKIGEIETGGGKEDLTAELTAQSAALTELEAAVNELPAAIPEANLVLGSFTNNGIYIAKDLGFDGWSEITINVQNKVQEPEGGVAVNVVGAWTINPDGSENTINGAYYNFTTDGKIQMIMQGDVSDMGTYSVEGNQIKLVSEDEEMTWYYNEDGGIAVEENAESIMWRLVPSGTLEVKENGDYDVTPKTKITVNVPNSGGGSGEYENIYEMKLIDLIQNKISGTVMPTEEEYLEQEPQVSELITILSGGVI